MAFYSSNYYETHDDLGEHYLTPYPSYEPKNQNLYEYDPTPNYHQTWPPIAYSASAHTNPISIEEDPKFYGQSYDGGASQTRFGISYNVSEFNEPAWDEYDPTPYGGGFDLAQTYGKPLSPSDETCYPLNGATNIGSGITPLSAKEVEQAPIPKLPSNGSQQPILAIEEEKQSQDLDTKEAIKPDESEESEEVEASDDHRSYRYDEKQVYEIVPSGYGLEAMDICESLFGYWPCLAKRGNGNGTCQQFCGEYGNNPWEGTADYLFGSSNPYGGRSDEGSHYLE